MLDNKEKILDLYVTGIDGGNPSPEQMHEIEQELSPLLNSKNIKKELTEKDYGSGASWAVLFIEWLNEPCLSATLNFFDASRFW